MNKTILALAFLVLFSGMTFAIANASVTEGTQEKFEGDPTAGDIITEGGNITDADIGVNASTEKWAGFFGNVTGQLVLAEATASPYMYSWTYNTDDGGEVCASVYSNPTWASIIAVTGAAIDNALGFNVADADSASNTLIDTDGTVDIDGASVTSAAVVTEGLGAWETVALNHTGGSGDQNLAFCVNISSNAGTFDGGTGDYQLMVPTDETASATETYYFFVELI